jgi:hypothetical protein
MARSAPMTPAEYRKWRVYAESLIQQAIDILDELDGCGFGGQRRC